MDHRKGVQSRLHVEWAEKAQGEEMILLSQRLADN